MHYSLALSLSSFVLYVLTLPGVLRFVMTLCHCAVLLGIYVKWGPNLNLLWRLEPLIPHAQCNEQCRRLYEFIEGDYYGINTCFYSLHWFCHYSFLTRLYLWKIYTTRHLEYNEMTAYAYMCWTPALDEALRNPMRSVASVSTYSLVELCSKHDYIQPVILLAHYAAQEGISEIYLQKYLYEDVAFQWALVTYVQSSFDLSANSWSVVKSHCGAYMTLERGWFDMLSSLRRRAPIRHPLYERGVLSLILGYTSRFSSTVRRSD